MLNAYNDFKSNMVLCTNLSALYDYLEATLTVPYSFDDILRAQLVYSVSAFDKLMHDLIRIGMVDIFAGRRTPTPKYSNYSVSLDTHTQLSTATIPPKEYWFTMHIMQNHKHLSFQDPDNVSDGLSFIWAEKHKWQQIAKFMNADEKNLKSTQRAVIDRRNSIVHEADINPVTGSRYLIAKSEVADVIAHINNVSEAIYNLVK